MRSGSRRSAKDGWIRQLRISSLPASGYVVAKIIASMVTSVTSVVLVLLLGRFYGDVHMPLWKWIAVGAAIWIGAMTFAALAVAIGYRYMPDTVQPITMFVWLGMSVFGGLFSSRYPGLSGRSPRCCPPTRSPGSPPTSSARARSRWAGWGSSWPGWPASLRWPQISVRSTAEKI